MERRSMSLGDTELQSELDAERANTAELRRIVAQQADALATIKRRKAVRAVLALDRYIRPYRTILTRHRYRLRTCLNQVKLLSGGIRTRRQVSERREILIASVEQLAPAQRDARRRSIVIVTDHSGAPVFGTTFDERDELLVVATNPLGEDLSAPHRLIASSGHEAVAAAAGSGAAAANGDLLCFLAPTIEPLEEGWLDRMAAVIRDDVVAAAPLVVHPEQPLPHATPYDLLVRELGLDVIAASDGVPTMRARKAGTAPDPSLQPVEVFAASAACLVVERGAYARSGGLLPLGDLDAAIVDLCVRLRAAGGRVVAVPESMVLDHRRVQSVASLTTPIDPAAKGWHEVLDRDGPALLREARGRRAAQSLTIALTVAAPSSKVAPRWGDWHIAEAFARSLRRFGHSVRIQTADLADDPAGRCCDVHVVLRGVQPVRRTPAQCHVLWAISHPEGINIRECDEADLVLVASPRLAAHIREHTATPVEVLLQATDPERFRTRTPDRRHAHAVAIVAKARDVMRKAVADALAGGLRPAIYGSGWNGLVDPGLVVADYVPNEALPVVYSSIGVLVADHWDTMRSWGMVSNRLFDALACGTPVISDYLPEVRELFGDAVPMYRDGTDLRELVDATLADPSGARHRAAAGREQVLARHTFDHRAHAFLDALARHGLDEPRKADIR
jgi:O-antigen biosynthesis protein